MAVLSLEHLRGHGKVTNGPNFNIVVSLGIGRPVQRGGEMREFPVNGAVRTYRIFIKLAVLHGHGLW